MTRSIRDCVIFRSIKHLTLKYEDVCLLKTLTFMIINLVLYKYREAIPIVQEKKYTELQIYQK